MATQTLDQKRAAYAWESIRSRCTNGNIPDGYTNNAKAMPALVMSNGLLATLAFFRQKDDHGKHLVQDVLSWLKRDLKWSDQDVPPGNEVSLFQGGMRKITGLDSLGYMRATEEAFEILRWIRQFASAV